MKSSQNSSRELFQSVQKFAIITGMSIAVYKRFVEIKRSLIILIFNVLHNYFRKYRASCKQCIVKVKRNQMATTALSLWGDSCLMQLLKVRRKRGKSSSQYLILKAGNNCILNVQIIINFSQDFFCFICLRTPYDAYASCKKLQVKV